MSSIEFKTGHRWVTSRSGATQAKIHTVTIVIKGVPFVTDVRSAEAGAELVLDLYQTMVNQKLEPGK